jgi:hypothetical protein
MYLAPRWMSSSCSERGDVLVSPAADSSEFEKHDPTGSVRRMGSVY